MDHHRQSNAAPPGLLVRDAGLLLLRWSAGLTLILFHARREVVTGWRFFWHHEPWPWVAELAERGFPLPQAVAAGTAAAALLASVFLLTGLLARVSALVLLVCALTGLFLYGAVPDVCERLLLYAGCYAVLLLCGPGRISLDAALAGGWRTRSPR